MTTQPEQILEDSLVAQLAGMGYGCYRCMMKGFQGLESPAEGLPRDM